MVNFKKVNSSKYKVWRVLSAPGGWSMMYRDRISALKGYEGAILFPEQLLGLSQDHIFSVSTYLDGNGVITNIQRIRDYQPVAHNLDLNSFEDISQYEHSRPDHPAGLGIGTLASSRDFRKSRIFTNQRAAIKFMTDSVQRSLDSKS